MEDLYDELNNYEDVNALQELRSENMELKVKLEEHAAAMEKLQKDYDTLEMEFKKLEHNYSSLLKTARSEIQRKTDRISQLNIEKDMMVLESLKKGRFIRRNFNKGPHHANNVSNEKSNKGKMNLKVKEDDIKQKTADAKNERCETTTVQRKEMVPNSGTYNKSNYVNKFENVGTRPEPSYSRKSNVKENITQHKTEYNDTLKTNAGSIKDRRKSMPAVSMPIEKFSSDDEPERYYAKDTRTNPLIEKFERRNENKASIDRQSNKTSETSSMDDRGSNYHEPTSKDSHRGRPSRNHDRTSYSSRDKYEGSLKYRKRYSPERGQKRQHREYQDDYNRQEHGRYRSIESPPPESNRYQRRYPDSKSNYDSHSRDHDKYRHRYEDNYAPKQRPSNDYDEPRSKRQKVESLSNLDSRYKEERRYYSDKDHKEIQSIAELSPHEYDKLRYSCQSPDFIHTDAAIANPIKEIMATAATPLEDPRLTSKRYVLIKENGKETLSSIVGRYSGYKPVNKAVWKFDRFSTPDALRRRPSECSDELVKNIYTDIDNPVADISMESGEVYESEGESRHNVRDKQDYIEDYYIQKESTGNIAKQATSESKVVTEKRTQTTSSRKEVSENLNKLKTNENKEETEKLSHQKTSSYKEETEKISKHATSLKKDVSEKPKHATSLNKEVSEKPSKHATSSNKEVSEKTLNQKTSSYKQETERVSEHATSLNKVVTDKRSKQASRDETGKLSKETKTTEKESKPIKYRIPKIGQNKHSQSKMDVPIIDLDENQLLHDNCAFKKGATEECLSQKSYTTPQLDERDHILSSKINESKKECQNQMTLSKMAMVADDLELSDDNSDNVDTHRRMVAEKNKNNSSIQPNFQEARKENSAVNNIENISFDNNETKKSVNPAQIETITKDDKTKELDSAKKHKNKKKRAKSKEVSKDSVESLETSHVPEKKTKPKKEKESKPQEVKNKFSDLFGDSSSLMTPEDLGIPSYLPISEDAQDAVDMKIDQIIDAPLLRDIEGDPSKAQSNIEMKKQEVATHDLKNTSRKSNNEDKEAKEMKRKKSMKRNEDIKDDNIQSETVYENVNSGMVLNEPDVVKTIIISTGVQPEITSENNITADKATADVEITTRNVIECNPTSAAMEFKRQGGLKALATSTPHKEFDTVSSIEVDAGATDYVCDTDVSKTAVSRDIGEQTVNQTDTNKLDSQDAPDVRIFVKRRRKLVKRPPMT